MFGRILIANRGEIASRIARTCRTIGVQAYGIYSNLDAQSAYLKDLNLALGLQGDSLKETYLNIEQIIALALEHQVEAIHPGYGFLAENAEFAKQCLENNLVFIGPKPETIASMALKVKLKLSLIRLVSLKYQGFTELLKM